MVNRTPNTRQEQDDAYKPGALEKKENAAATGAPMEAAKKAANTLTKSTAATRMLSVVKNSEDAPWNLNINPVDSQPKKVAFLNRFGPFAGIVVSLAAAVFGIAAFVAPGFSIVAFAETLGNALNDADPALSKRSLQMISRKADGIKNSFAESSEGKCNIRCKFGTMSDTMLRNLRANGFDVEVQDKKYGGRSVIKSITFPGKEGSRVTVTTGAGFSEAIKDPANAARFYRVFNPASYYLNSRFGTVLSKAFGLDKLAKVVGDSKERATEAWRKTLGLEGASAEEDPSSGLSKESKLRTGLYKTAFAALDSTGSRLAGKGANIVAGGCSVYNSSRAVSYAIKAVKMAKFAQVAFAIINLAHQIKAGDNPSPEAVEFVGNQLTQIDLNEYITDSNGEQVKNAFYGKTAFDSKGYAIADRGDDPGVLTPQEQVYAVNPVGSLSSVLSQATSVVVEAGEPAIAVASGLCSVANNPVIGTVATCGEQIVAALVTAIETFGVGAIASAGWCIAKVTAIGIATSAAATALVQQGISMIVGGELSGIDESTVGAPIGNMSYSGTASIYGATAANLGMKAGSEEEIKQYAIDTADIKSQNDAIARYEAQDSPFDIYNKYSFLGSIGSTLGIANLTSSSVSSTASAIANIIPTSLSTLSTAVNAADTTTVAEKKASLYMLSNSSSLQAVGAASDVFGNASYVLSSAELNMDGGAVAQQMIDDGEINPDTGKAKPGKDYKKFVDYCVERFDSNGIIPLGETPALIEDADYAWKVGLKCQEESAQISRYRVFTMDLAINDTMDEEPGAKQKETAEKFVSPVNDGFVITDGFGPRVAPTAGASTWHVALDYDNRSDKTVMSIGDGKVISTDGQGSNNVIRIQHADGLISEYWHMYDKDIVVKTGDEVTAGQKLGIMGDSGIADGVHLHFVLDITEVESPEDYEKYTKNSGGRSPIGAYINPAQFLQAKGLPGYEDYQ